MIKNKWRIDDIENKKHLLNYLIVKNDNHDQAYAVINDDGSIILDEDFDGYKKGDEVLIKDLDVHVDCSAGAYPIDKTETDKMDQNYADHHHGQVLKAVEDRENHIKDVAIALTKSLGVAKNYGIKFILTVYHPNGYIATNLDGTTWCVFAKDFKYGIRGDFLKYLTGDKTIRHLDSRNAKDDDIIDAIVYLLKQDYYFAVKA